MTFIFIIWEVIFIRDTSKTIQNLQNKIKISATEAQQLNIGNRKPSLFMTLPYKRAHCRGGKSQDNIFKNSLSLRKM